MNNCAKTESSEHDVSSRTNAATGAIAAIHQPNYIPWLGYFFKIAHADRFVFLDTVAYPCGSFVNRNSIKTISGPTWLSIPVLTSHRSGQLIRDVETDNTHSWTTRHLATLRSNYSRAPHFKEVLDVLEPLYLANAEETTLLADFNIRLIGSIAIRLGLGTQFVRSSELNVSGCKTDLLLDICYAVRAGTYLAGAGAKSYQEDNKFEAAGIKPVYSSFTQPNYPQRFGEFVPNLSIVDVLMNCGFWGTRQLLGIGPFRG